MRDARTALLISAIAVIGVNAPLSAAHEPPSAGKEQPSAAATEKPPARQSAPDTYKIHGRCVDHGDSLPVAGIRMLLFEIPGHTLPIVQVAETIADEKGHFEFAHLVAARASDRLNPLLYIVVPFADDRPYMPYIIGHNLPQERQGIELRLNREEATLSGRIVNAQCEPVAGAAVGARYSFEGRTLPGILSAVSGPDGRFTINKLAVFRLPNGGQFGGTVSVAHPDYPEAEVQIESLPADLSIRLPDGCTVTGSVIDRVTGRPAAQALITCARSQDHSVREYVTSTDREGRFRIVVPEGRYTFLAEWPERVCVALADRECIAGQQLELPQLVMISGGLIAGQVIDTKSGKPVSVSQNGDSIILGLFGPSFPAGRVISPVRLAPVDENGHFALRAAPGENYPYFVNQQGDRMAWDTQQQPPVLVKEGETTAYNMLITPQTPQRDKLKTARALVDALPKPPAERTARILAEFDRLKSMSENMELWCSLMRELVTIGPTAVPQICEELDRTNQDRVLRRLSFALRAIGDPRAVPALIRAIPKTLVSASSDFGFIVQDPQLAAFMHQHHLGGMKGLYLSYGRPVRELFGALHKLTGQDFDDSEIYSLHLSEDPRRHSLQRRLYLRQARRWQTWWEANWTKFTHDTAYENVHLVAADETLPPPKSLGRTSHLGDGISGEVLSPASEQGKYATYFLDLDTGYQPKWPAHIPQDESRLDQKQLAKWALENGVDLMCVTHRAPDGTETYVLKAFNMRVWELTPREVLNLDGSVAAAGQRIGRAVERETGRKVADQDDSGDAIADKPDTAREVAEKLRTGRAAGEFLIHNDAASGRQVPNADAAFLFETRDGSLGLIEITDHVTRTEDITGRLAAPKGVGYHRGVKFDLKSIIP
jgi:hypothetical protein